MAEEVNLRIADRSWPSHARQEEVADDGRRERHRQAAHGLDDAATGEVSLGEEVPESDAHDGDDDRRLESSVERDRQWIPDPGWYAEPVEPRVGDQCGHADSVLPGGP